MAEVSRYNGRGEEIPSSVPVAAPVGFTRPPTLQELRQRLVQDEQLRQSLLNDDVETFEEADDFEIPGEDMSAPYEENYDPLHTTAREQEIRGGFVQERPVNKVLRAKETIEKHKKKPQTKEGEDGKGGK